MQNKGGIKEQTVRAVITRADGTKEDLGIIAHVTKNPIKNFWWKNFLKLKRRLKLWQY